MAACKSGDFKTFDRRHFFLEIEVMPVWHSYKQKNLNFGNQFEGDHNTLT